MKARLLLLLALCGCSTVASHVPAGEAGNVPAIPVESRTAGVAGNGNVTCEDVRAALPAGWAQAAWQMMDCETQLSSPQR
jgi:hypothetical protein